MIFNPTYVIVYYDNVKHKFEFNHAINKIKLFRKPTIKFGNGNILKYEEGPNVIYSNGTKMWFIGGKSHRNPIKNRDGSLYYPPTVEFKSGGKRWHHRGEKYRELWPDGREEWYENGKLHRGPINGVHRPAKITAGGKKLYYKYGTEYSPTVVADSDNDDDYTDLTSDDEE